MDTRVKLVEYFPNICGVQASSRALLKLRILDYEHFNESDATAVSKEEVEKLSKNIKGMLFTKFHAIFGYANLESVLASFNLKERAAFLRGAKAVRQRFRWRSLRNSLRNPGMKS